MGTMQYVYKQCTCVTVHVISSTIHIESQSALSLWLGVSTAFMHAVILGGAISFLWWRVSLTNSYICHV